VRGTAIKISPPIITAGAFQTEVQVSTKAHTDGLLPTRDTVIGTTTHTGLDVSMYGSFKRTQYAWLTTAGSTYQHVGGYHWLEGYPDKFGSRGVHTGGRHDSYHVDPWGILYPRSATAFC
jgi:hypothetical protein